MPYFLRWLLAVAAVIGAVLLVAALHGDATNDHDRIPVPPPGHHYCTNGEQLAFCPAEGDGSWQ